MKYLITGCAGFVGYHLVKKLFDEQKDIEIVGVDDLNNYYSPKVKKKRLNQLKKDARFKFYKMDISKFESLYKIIETERIEVIVHLAAQAGVRYSLENPWVYEKTNCMGTLNIFESAKRLGIKKVIYASSASVYGNLDGNWSEDKPLNDPISLYAATKLHDEQIARVYYNLFGFKSIGLRFFTAYGEYGRPDMAFWTFTKNILNDKPIDVYNNGDMERDFTYISDIIDGVIKAINYDCDYEIFNLSGGKEHNLKYIIECIEKESKKQAIRNYMPIQLGDIKKTSADITKARTLLGYSPKISIEEGIHKYVSWFKKNKKWIDKL
ncbi:MAG: GDP-mannose 4,6-dehydratase [archaeon]|jgi:UDP-glucuronate 4-epimerase